VTTHSGSIVLVSTIFGLTYLGLALGEIPGFLIDRAGIALERALPIAASPDQRAFGISVEPRIECSCCILFKPLVHVMPQKAQAWLALAMSSTLAGNLTLLGSVANLIVVENARRAGTELGFLEYLKVGVPLTALTILVGITWLALVHY
jgi:hypothetical protein